MSTERIKQDVKYVKNILKFSKKYVQTVIEPNKIHRGDYTKISIGHRITIQKTDNSDFYYFFFLGNQIFNLYDDEILISGAIKFNYKEYQEKDVYFNAMINDSLHGFSKQDFSDMEYLYKRLRTLL